MLRVHRGYGLVANESRQAIKLSVRRDKQPNQSAVIGKRPEHNNDSNGHHHFGPDRRTFKPLQFHALAIGCNPNGSVVAGGASSSEDSD